MEMEGGVSGGMRKMGKFPKWEWAFGRRESAAALPRLAPKGRARTWGTGLCFERRGCRRGAHTDKLKGGAEMAKNRTTTKRSSSSTSPEGTRNFAAPASAARDASTEEDREAMPAAIEYVGIAGVSKDCQDAVLRLIQFGNRITKVAVLSSSRDHCLLLTLEDLDLMAIKSGFASGYGGEGPRRFSYVLQVLDSHGAEIEEYDVSPEFLERIDNAALTRGDLEMLQEARPRRPSRWHDYVSEHHFKDAR
jgi:hypothetical protein